VGFFGKYLLLLLPIFLSARQLKRVATRRIDFAALLWGYDRRLRLICCRMDFNYLVFVFSGAELL
jgi:hypothetical protein